MLHEKRLMGRTTTRIPIDRLLPVTLLLLVSFSLRIARLDAQALRGDEAFTVVHWGSRSIPQLLDEIAPIDPQPPAALIAVRTWIAITGTSEFAARMFSVLASTLTTAAIFALSRTLLTWRAALLAILLAALNPYQIWHAQDIRIYAAWMALSSLGLLALLQVVNKPNSNLRLALYVLLTTLTLYTFYLEAFVILAHNVYALYRIAQKSLTPTRWIVSQVSILLLIAPWYLQPHLWSSGYNPTAGQPTIDILGALTEIVLGTTLPPILATPLIANLLLSDVIIVAVLGITLAAMLREQNTSRDHKLLLISVGLLPLALLSGLTLVSQRGYFWPRYITGSSPVLLIVIAAGITSLYQRGRKLQGLALLLLTVSLFGAGGWNYFLNAQYAKAPDWHGLRAALLEAVGPEDLVLRNYPDPSFDYYFHGRLQQMILPTSRTDSPEITMAQVRHLLATHNTIWFMPQPGYWDPDQVVRNEIEEQGHYLAEEWISGFHVFQYASYASEHAGHLAVAVNHHFRDTAILASYRVATVQHPFQQGADTTIELAWTPLEVTQSPLTIFVHLLDDTGLIVIQDDHPPQHGRITSTQWTEPFRDTHSLSLPADMRAGAYTIIVGLYDPLTGERILTTNGQDSVQLLRFTISPQ